MKAQLMMKVCLFISVALAATILADSKTCPVTVPECECLDFDLTSGINCADLGVITKIPAFLPNNRKFRWLQIWKNSTITQLPDNSFKNLKMRQLFLRKLGIESIQRAAFSGLEDILEDLILEENKISSLSGLNNLPNLKGLHVSDNSITKITKADLAPFATSLTLLDLSRNPLVDFSKAFDSLSKLERLLLIGCQLTTLDSSTFIAASSLARLSLGANRMEEIPTEAISKAQNLRLVDISENNITIIKKKAFANMPKLDTVFLHSNKIGKIEPEAFFQLPSLGYISMKRNKITGNITNDAFVELPSLHTLDVSYNHITSIEHPFPNLPKLRYLTLNQNAFHCDCDIAWMRYYEGMFREMNEVCRTPEAFRQLGYTLLNFDASGCPVITTPTMPSITTPVAAATLSTPTLFVTIGALCLYPLIQ